MGAGRGGSDIVNAILWLLVLIFLSWWVACICFPLYVLFSVLATCVPGLKDLADILIQGINLPAKCAENMMQCRALF